MIIKLSLSQCRVARCNLLYLLEQTDVQQVECTGGWCPVYSVQHLYTLHGYIYSSARPDQAPAQCLGLAEGYRCQFN